CARYFSNYDYW
nr:immunoglobulin heavy chain junction region [Mus musculus]